MRRLALLLLAACAATAPEEERAREASRQAIVKGVDSDAAQDAVVLVVHYDSLSKDGSASCSGTLLAPRLVLTARHCVAVTDESARCGDGPAGGAVYANHAPSKLFVFAGTERPDLLSGAPQAARGAEILDDGAETLCNHDLALLLLDRPLPGARIAPVRLDGSLARGDEVTLVGWGVTEKISTPQTRQQREGVVVLAVGPGPLLGDAEVLVNEGACSGDSGGPALTASGAVAGVLSRGGNGTGQAGAEGCLGGEDVYTSPSKFKELIVSAYEKAGQEPWYEGQPNPLLAKNGAACAADGACRSNTCDMHAKTCAQDCSSDACPAGSVCADQDGRRLCDGAPADEGGCAAARGKGTPPGGAPSSVGIAATLLAILARRRPRA